jgi:sodium/proline symporter
MFVALITLPVIAMVQLGGAAETFNIATALMSVPGELGFTEWTGIGVVSFLSIVSIAAWGLGYFGQPHILARFMGIRRARDIKPARRIAMVWVVITLAAAVFVGVVGKAYMSTVVSADQLAVMDGEKIFIYLVQSILTDRAPPFLQVFY